MSSHVKARVGRNFPCIVKIGWWKAENSESLRHGHNGQDFFKISKNFTFFMTIIIITGGKNFINITGLTFVREQGTIRFVQCLANASLPSQTLNKIIFWKRFESAKK